LLGNVASCVKVRKLFSRWVRQKHVPGERVEMEQWHGGLRLLSEEMPESRDTFLRRRLDRIPLFKSAPTETVNSALLRAIKS
jgi:hypothetical protein